MKTMVSDMTHVCLGDVAREIKQKAPAGHELPTIGLEHLDPGELGLARWDEGTKTTFTKAFSKGQVLFGRRRAYLRKAAVAPFDGVCSGDITVIAAKSSLSPRLLPFIIQNDALFEHAVTNSSGSLSPRVKWQGLSQFEFELPGIGKQEELADILWAAQETRSHYRQLLTTCDDVVKSQFVEMFGGVKHPLVMASEIMRSFRNGVSPSKNGGVHSRVLTLSAITQGKFDPSAWKDGTFKEEPPADKRVSDRDFYICRGNGNKELVGTAAFADRDYPNLVFPDTMIAGVIDDARVDRVYLSSAWAQPVVRSQIESKARTTNGTFKINQKIVAGVRIPLPPLTLQQEFASFVAQVDKSKFAVQKALDELNATTKKILNQELGLGDV